MVEGKKVIIGSAHFVFEDEGCRIPEGEQAKFDTCLLYTSYEFTSCPAAEFAIRHGLTDIMPALCNVDYASMELDVYKRQHLF